MKLLRFLGFVLLAGLLLSTYPPLSNAQETCDGSPSITIDQRKDFALCWKKNPEPDVQGYLIYKSRIAGQKGEEFSTFLHADCSTDICETDRLQVDEIGTHYFKVYAYDANSSSGASNEIILIVQDMPPTNPSGCSIRKFLP